MASKPVDGQIASAATDAILEAGLQVARGQTSSRRTSP
jgi:hypothetical protein